MAWRTDTFSSAHVLIVVRDDASAIPLLRCTGCAARCESRRPTASPAPASAPRSASRMGMPSQTAIITCPASWKAVRRNAVELRLRGAWVWPWGLSVLEGTVATIVVSGRRRPGPLGRRAAGAAAGGEGRRSAACGVRTVRQKRFARGTGRRPGAPPQAFEAADVRSERLSTATKPRTSNLPPGHRPDVPPKLRKTQF